MELTWHGHSTWWITVKNTTLLVDPNFSNQFTSVDPRELPSADFVLLTHGHMDHLEDVPHFTDSTIVATPEVSKFVADELGASNAVFDFGMNIGASIELGDAFVSMHESAHTNEIGTDYGDRSYRRGGGPPVGYTVSDSPVGDRQGDSSSTFYHAGDTALTVGMRDIIGELYEPDAAALPIGGSFTMGPMEASVAVDWLDVDHAFPMHYNTAPPIHQDPSEFVQQVGDRSDSASVRVLSVDETFALS